ncbi:odorant receptor 49b-like [Euwallacea similis]|uniref:odorant receptor 49b-like n=1 Tax=Euwallacea similis TaxID=1736056 RepID=UPI00344F8144
MSSREADNCFQVREQDYYLATTTLPLAIGGIVVSATNIIFAVKHEMWSELMERTTDCTKFGRSLNFNEIKRQGDRLGKIVYLSSIFSAIIMAIYEIFTEKACLLSNSGRNEICGLVIPVWLPSGLADSTMFKRCVLLYQVFTLLVGIMFTAILSLQNQVCQFIEDKTKHLSVLFNKINAAGTSTLQYQQFSFCMEYHQYILKLCEQLNHTSKKTLGHVTLSTSLVMSFFLYHGMKGNYPWFCYAGLFILNIGFMCHTGQRLEDAMSKVGDSLYLSSWYDCCIEIRKMIPFVVMRSQRSVGLQAVPIGILNYVLFAVVMKTTYTYMNLINNTGAQ